MDKENVIKQLKFYTEQLENGTLEEYEGGVDMSPNGLVQISFRIVYIPDLPNKD